MECRRVKLGWLGLIASLTLLAPAFAQPMPAPPAPETGPVCSVPLNELAPAERERVRFVLERPTLTARGRSEVFTCQPDHYFWLLDHPVQTVRLWRCLGVKCADIAEQGASFSWNDGKGSAMRWHEVYRSAELRVWYADGKVNPSFLLPTASIQAVVAVHHTEGTDAVGRPAVRQHIELALHTDSHTLAAAAKLLGASVPHVAQQYVGQIQMFYGALAWYLDQHPSRAVKLFEQLRQPAATDHLMKFPAE